MPTACANVTFGTNCSAAVTCPGAYVPASGTYCDYTGDQLHAASAAPGPVSSVAATNGGFWSAGIQSGNLRYLAWPIDVGPQGLVVGSVQVSMKCLYGASCGKWDGKCGVLANCRMYSVLCLRLTCLPSCIVVCAWDTPVGVKTFLLVYVRACARMDWSGPMFRACACVCIRPFRGFGLFSFFFFLRPCARSRVTVRGAQGGGGWVLVSGESEGGKSAAVGPICVLSLWPYGPVTEYKRLQADPSAQSKPPHQR